MWSWCNWWGMARLKPWLQELELALHLGRQISGLLRPEQNRAGCSVLTMCYIENTELLHTCVLARTSSPVWIKGLSSKTELALPCSLKGKVRSRILAQHLVWEDAWRSAGKVHNSEDTRCSPWLFGVSRNAPGRSSPESIEPIPWGSVKENWGC